MHYSAIKRFLCIVLLQVFVANGFAFAFEARDHVSHPAQINASDMAATTMPLMHQDHLMQSLDQSKAAQPSHTDCQEHCHTQHNANNVLLGAVAMPIIFALENFVNAKSSSRFVAVNYQPPVPPPTA